MADLKDVGRRIINHLLGIKGRSPSEIDVECIIVADDLTPSDTAQLDQEKVLGFYLSKERLPSEEEQFEAYREVLAKMVETTIIIKNETGLHARPAANLVNEAAKYPCDLRIRKGSKEVNLKSMLGLLSLGAGKGDEVTLIADGRDEKETIAKLVEFIDKLEK